MVAEASRPLTGPVHDAPDRDQGDNQVVKDAERERHWWTDEKNVGRDQGDQEEPGQEPEVPRPCWRGHLTLPRSDMTMATMLIMGRP